MLKTFIAALAASILIVSTPAMAYNDDVAIGVGAFVGGLIIGGALNDHHHHKRYRHYKRHQYVQPVPVYRPHKVCWNEIVGYYYNRPIVEYRCGWR